ncbi:MAG: caspase domain-containing protein [Elainellaceae cyanobacterium]
MTGMTQYWAIAVGINHYSFIQQPLMYAERDAAALYRYWINAEFPPEHCHLLTQTALNSTGYSDDSEPPGAIASGPVTQAVIQQTVAEVTRQIGAQSAADEALLWVAFSGYGLHEGGEDYLLAADSSPEDLSTAVALSQIVETLHQAAVPAVLLLDLKPLGLPSDAALGKGALALAEGYSMPVILSCRPGQSSHETLALRQGIFTASLLDSLEHNCITLEQLALDLGDRMPALSQHHWRPVQNPALFIPDDSRYRLLVPGKPIENPFPPPEEVSQRLAGPQISSPRPDKRSETAPASEPDTPDPSPSASLNSGVTPDSKAASSQVPVLPRPSVPTVPAPMPQATVPLPTETETETEADLAFWRRIGLWGVALLALLIVGVVARNRSALFTQGTASPDRAGDRPTAVSDPSEGATAALASARAAIEAERYEDALKWLDTVPAEQQDREYARLRQVAQAEAGVPAAEGDTLQVNAEILAQAIASLNQEREETPVNQASDFARAITIAERIQPGQPLYDEAQSYIQRWGNTVIDLAEARAQAGNYVDAIGAARLIPPSVAEVYPRAQARIQQWQQQMGQGTRQQSLVAAAEAMIQADQASSYSEAIAHLRLVERRDADYDQAQTLIESWSSDILDLAYQRAYQGRFSGAIDAASLVPQDASIYVEAREAMADWQWQVDTYGDTYNDPIGDDPIGTLSGLGGEDDWFGENYRPD